MTPEHVWEALLGESGIPCNEVRALPARVDQSPADFWNEVILPTVQILSRDATEWPAYVPDLETRLSKGLYSPVQLLLYYCAREAKDAILKDYPFEFDLVARLTSTLLNPYESADGAKVHWPPGDSSENGVNYRILLQSIFRLRELREEREPLSLEVHLPLKRNEDHQSLPIKELAEVFGRGIAVATGAELAQWVRQSGWADRRFPDHSGAPASALYSLNPAPFHHIPERQVGIVLRRDGHVAVATRGNPLLEFYDGGWHVVDFESSRVAIDDLIRRTFESRGGSDRRLAELLLRLAYHMASHWHGGILAIVDENGLETNRILEPPNEDSVWPAIKTALGELPDPPAGGTINLTGLDETRVGRALLSCAIQDGAVLFDAKGKFLGSGRMVSTPAISAQGKGGARTRAASALGHYGVALKISQDGAITVYCKPDGMPEPLPQGGLRIR